jgi:hypothetical protein
MTCIIQIKDSQRIRRAIVGAKYVLSTCGNRNCINPEHLSGFNTRQLYMQAYTKLTAKRKKLYDARRNYRRQHGI